VRVALVRSREPARAGEADAPLIAALRACDVEVAQPCWDDPTVAWEAHDLVVVRTTWDYAGRRDEFLAWADAVAAEATLCNPADVLRWNTHKGYLIELEERGAPVVPTAWLGQGDQVDLGRLLASRGWPAAMAKPAVGVGGRGIVRVEPDGADRAQAGLDGLLAEGDVLVQPFLATVESEGELSVVLVEGEVTHAVRKRPTAGEYRVHQERGGRYERVEPDPDVTSLARWMVEATGHDLLLARLDLLADEMGVAQVVELEATEPDLYLDLAPDAAARLAEAIVTRAGG
jgi:glutathione synthase/RimK-type ligase-like ATP-grasp enzyme